MTPDGQERLATAALRSATARKILAYLDRQPVASQGTVARMLHMDAKVAGHHLPRLEEAGLVAWQEEGDAVFLHVTSEAQPWLARLLRPATAPAAGRPADSGMVHRIRSRFQVPG